MKLFNRMMTAIPEPGSPAATPPTEPAAPAAPPAPAPGATPPQAATVDTEAITRQAEEKAVAAAEKKMEAVFKSMLEQQGLDADTISKMTAEWKASQRTPETELKEAREALAAAQAENQTLERTMLAQSKSVPADKAAKYVKLAESYMDDSTDFAAALDAALADFPIAQDPPPVYAPGPGSKPLDGEMDEFAKKLAKYKK